MPARQPWGTRLRGAVAQAFDLPRELVLDLPRLTFHGPVHVAVENHRGLVEFEAGRVTIATASGRLVVVGRDLRLGVVRPGEITIAGVVAAVSFEPPPVALR